MLGDTQSSSGNASDADAKPQDTDSGAGHMPGDTDTGAAVNAQSMRADEGETPDSWIINAYAKRSSPRGR